MQRIVLASNNAGKIKEFKQIFQQCNIEVIPQAQLGVEEIEEPFTTFIENSLHKARHCAKVTGLPALADDSGLCVPALAGAPGIYSARYAGSPKSDQANIAKLLTDLTGINEREAYFYCSLVFVRHAHDPQPVIGDGILNGRITFNPVGGNGHGYDPVFYVATEQATLSEVSDLRKNQISHRGLALGELIAKLQKVNLIA